MIVYGASGHAKVIVDILLGIGIKVDKIVDADPAADEIFGIRVEKVSSETVFNADTQAVIAIGSNRIRKEIALRHPFLYTEAIHPRSCVSPYVIIGEGTVVMANVSVNPDVVIGKHCIINTGAVVEHDCILEDYVHISPNAALAGNVTVGEGSHVGAGVSVIPGIRIGKWATIGAGAVVIRDVPDGATVVGNPGRIIKTDTSDENAD
ncbi:Acetyltransferase [Flavobacteriaceae bacterium 3519-10]|nr:Acetyltransferase [Flavobacteriaceae bacterium 3519-10]